MKIKTCFADKYYAPTPTASMRKLPLVADEIEKRGYAELIDPGSIDPKILKKLHSPAYVEAFIKGVGDDCSSQGWPWTKKVRDGVLAIQAGQLLGAQNALAFGLAANVAQGFHHAGYRRGSGFCTFNGLALVAQEFPDKKVFVLDCDEHSGNGTEEFTTRLPNLFNFTIFGSNMGCRGKERSICRQLPAITDNFSLYLQAVEDGFAEIVRQKPDLLLYQAGADPHINDPLGSLGMTTEQMMTRDRTVFEFCKKQTIPTLFVLAGGYQEPLENTVQLHVNTFQMAYDVYR